LKPILFEIFGFPVRAYGFFIAVAFLAGLWLARRVAMRRRPEYVTMVDDFATIAMVSAIVGARVWEVAFTWDYYGTHLNEIVAIWHGGLSIQGAIAGAALAAIWFARSRQISFWDFADTLIPGVVLGQAIGRLGACLLNGDAYGKPTGTGFGIIYAPGTMAYATFGAVRLWPAEVFEGLWDLAIMVITLVMLRRERQKGNVFLWYAILYSVGRFSLEFLRADSLQFMGMKAAQLTSVLIALVAVATLAVRRLSASKTAG
jgi:phosphatidylglycerol:prolipoprotein diacylglycerol transferase